MTSRKEKGEPFGPPPVTIKRQIFRLYGPHHADDSGHYHLTDAIVLYWAVQHRQAEF